MGETSFDTQREIESIRDDIARTVEELERRARRLVDLRAQAEQHPAAIGVIGFGLFAGLTAVAYNAVAGYRESRKPVNRLRRRAGDVADDVGERWSRTQERLPYRLVRNSREDESVDASREEPSMLKKLLWMGLSAGAIALAGLLARRVSSAIWEAVMHEPPPTAKV
jgi:hypothetical protein